MAGKESKSKVLWDARIVRQALIDALRKLNPRTMMRNPVMFVVEIGSVLTTVLLCTRPWRHSGQVSGSICRSRCGSGSRCCLPTLPKPWPKDAARRRPTRCARPSPRPSRNRLLPNGRHGGRLPAAMLRAGDLVLISAGRHDSRRRRSHRRRRVGR